MIKYTFATIATNLVSLFCVAASFYLALHGIKGWGWFLFIAVVCSAKLNWTEKKSNEKV